jgi:DNA-3-methyladenine glycosylase
MPFDFDLLQNHKKLNRKFYLHPVVEVAQKLLGKLFVKLEKDALLAGMITEVEAYDGINDEASHSFNGETKRNKHMFFEGGFTYVYLSYGVHHCLNVVTGPKDYGAAILIRAMEPVSGIQTFSLRRFGKTTLNEKEFQNLLNGPGKISQAFNLTKNDSGKDLLKDELFILGYKKINEKLIESSGRIGISKSVDLPWRFYISNSKFLSR